jgi:hypothetical protein
LLAFALHPGVVLDGGPLQQLQCVEEVDVDAATPAQAKPFQFGLRVSGQLLAFLG